jgi:HPt (histidine-containing phosphotransfer) domain-containing protein
MGVLIRATPSRSGFDPAALDRLAVAIGPEHLIHVMDQVLRSARASCRELAARADRGDWTGVADVAHSMKAECGYMGAAGLVLRLEDLETRAAVAALPAGEIGGIIGGVEEFLGELEREREARAPEPARGGAAR